MGKIVVFDHHGHPVFSYEKQCTVASDLKSAMFFRMTTPRPKRNVSYLDAEPKTIRSRSNNLLPIPIPILIVTNISISAAVDYADNIAGVGTEVSN